MDYLKLFPPKKQTTFYSSLKWTASIADLIEIVYSFYHAKAINNGEVTIKQIVDTFEKAFNVELKGYSHTFLRIRGRSGERIVFINKLKEHLNAAILDADK